jgi:hypothetical protein
MVGGGFMCAATTDPTKRQVQQEQEREITQLYN